MSIFVVVGMGCCWIAEKEEVMVWLDLLDIGSVGIVVDMLLEGM